MSETRTLTPGGEEAGNEGREDQEEKLKTGDLAE